MDIERIKLKTTLKCGRNVWRKGHIFDKKDGPFPGDINDQLRHEANLPESMRKIEVLGTETVSIKEPDLFVEQKSAIDTERRELAELWKDLEDGKIEIDNATRNLEERIAALDVVKQDVEEDKKKLHTAFQELDKDRLDFENKKATWEPETAKDDEEPVSETNVVTFNEMVDKIVKANNGSWNAAAKAIGTSNTSLKNWYDGKSKPSADNLLKVERAYRVFGRINDDSG